MPYQIVELELDEAGAVVSRRPTEPLFELHRNALKISELDAARSGSHYGFDSEANRWWARDTRGRHVQFSVEPVELV